MAVNDYSKIKVRSGTYNYWTAVNPILGEDEPAHEYDTHRLKIGDGKTHYNNLPYIGGTSFVLSNRPEIIKFTCTPSIIVKGQVITSLRFNWQLNRPANVITIKDNTDEPVVMLEESELTTYTLEDQNIFYDNLEALNYTITCEYPGDLVSDITTIRFANYVYSGAYRLMFDIDSVDDMTSFLRKTAIYDPKNYSLDINCNDSFYIYIAIPAKYGNRQFVFNHLSGGLDRLVLNDENVFSVTNQYGYTENYYVYRSNQHSLGQTQLTII